MKKSKVIDYLEPMLICAECGDEVFCCDRCNKDLYENEIIYCEATKYKHYCVKCRKKKEKKK